MLNQRMLTTLLLTFIYVVDFIDLSFKTNQKMLTTLFLTFIYVVDFIDLSFKTK